MTHRSRAKFALLSLFALSLLPALAQQSHGAEGKEAAARSLVQRVKADSPRTLFHLDFVVKELDGKHVISTRNYTTSVAANSKHEAGCSIRSGNRVPVASSANSKETSFQYLDVGVNIDCSDAEFVGGELSFFLAVDLSSIADHPGEAQLPTPVVRSTRWRAPVLLSIGKSTVVFSSDDASANHSVQLEVTATPLT